MFEVGAEIVVSHLDNDKYLPAVAYNSKHNEYLVVWHNKWADGSRDIYAQRVTATGELKSYFAVSAGANSRAQPAVAYDPGNDRYLVVWAYDVLGNGSNWDIYGRFIPWNGPDSSLSEFPIIDWTSSQMYPQIVLGIAQNEFLVVWENQTNGAVKNYISARRVNAGGGFPDTGGFTIASALTDFRLRPSVTYNLARNEYLVVYDDNFDIFGTRVSGNGSLLAGGEFKIAGWPSEENTPSVAACRNLDQFLVVWQSNLGTHHDIYGRILAGDGTPTPIVIHIAGEGYQLEEERPAVVCDATGDAYLAVWQQRYGPTGAIQGWAVRGVSASGDMGGTWGLTGIAAVTNPVLASGSVNSLAVWEHQRSVGGYQDIHASMLHMERLFVPRLFK